MVFLIIIKANITPLAADGHKDSYKLNHKKRALFQDSFFGFCPKDC